MENKPVAAGKSSFDLIDQDLALSRIVSETATVYADLACGAGRYSLALAERVGPDAAIHALDLWPDGLAQLNEAAAKRSLKNIRTQLADLTKPLPLEDGSVQVCLMATALHDLPEAGQETLLAEIRRILAPGGTFVLIEFKELDHGPGPSKDKKIGPEKAEAMLMPLGFVLEETLDLGEFPYLARFRLPG